MSEEKSTMKTIVRAEESQVIIDDLDEEFSKHEEFRIFVPSRRQWSPSRRRRKRKNTRRRDGRHQAGRKKSKGMTRWAVSIWLILLTALVSLIVYMRVLKPLVFNR